MTDRPTIDHPPATLPLDAWHRAAGARMVPFAGYAMPIQYPDGIIAEHEWTRSHAGLFDVSHMGQLTVSGAGAAAALEALLPADLQALAPGRMRYSLLLNDKGGVIDDLIVTNITEGEPTYFLVVNGATKVGDIAHLQARLPAEVALTPLPDLALLALQGPEAALVLDRLFPGIATELGFMEATSRMLGEVPVRIFRSGYTGEDGFELSLPAVDAVTLADRLMAEDEVRPIGLGARDSLRLEAGLPLYGHDLDTETDPVMAGLAFAITKARRADGGFPGAARITALLRDGAPMRRVGLVLEGRMAAREGSLVFAGEEQVGRVTSGGFSPTLGHPIALAFVDTAHIAPGTALFAEVRGKRLPATVVRPPFVPHRYHRKGEA
ncbi:glycine cleavage system aminomethyltransferase GcvT [Croceibacterium ferulae]|uniref:glycine cleavage system aminomethyltransferase GcvT n=1 Tax=Croceibacterium ferulae TaxID=1854641 RepID=UPI000EB0EC08|nr:glycine cleavage system aminomethyltransferase GcvT [Croceibacterium ferulae]